MLHVGIGQGNVTTWLPLILFPSNHYNGREGVQPHKISFFKPHVAQAY
jgi:hypothetical protein